VLLRRFFFTPIGRLAGAAAAIALALDEFSDVPRDVCEEEPHRQVRESDPQNHGTCDDQERYDDRRHQPDQSKF